MKFVTPVFLVKTLIAAMLLVCQLAIADLLVMKNGDRITGDITRIWDEEVTIEPDYSDEFQVDLSAIANIDSRRDLEIELKDGTSLMARLSGANEDGEQLIKTAEKSLAISLDQIFELDEPEEDFEWDSNIEVSADFNSGNTESYNTKLKADTTVKIRDHRHIAEITFLEEEISNVQTQDQDLFLYNYNWLFKDPWFFSTRLSFEQDPIIELDNRIILSLGVGRDVWLTPRRELNVQLGAGGQTEEISMVTSQNAVLTWALRYRQDFFKDDLELYHNHTITSNVSGRSNTSYKTTTGLRYEITDLLYANLSLDYDYETHPANVAVSEDIRMLFGLGAEF